MRVEGEDAAMNLFGMPVGSCLLNQKIEESGRDAVACRSQSFGMELHTPYRIFVEDSIASGILSDDQPVTLNPGATCLTAW